MIPDFALAVMHIGLYLLGSVSGVSSYETIGTKLSLSPVVAMAVRGLLLKRMRKLNSYTR
jgi:phosphate/sulfate permease